MTKLAWYVFVTVALPITWVLDTAIWAVLAIKDEFPYRPRHVSYREAYRLIKRRKRGAQ